MQRWRDRSFLSLSLAFPLTRLQQLLHRELDFLEFRGGGQRRRPCSPHCSVLAFPNAITRFCAPRSSDDPGSSPLLATDCKPPLLSSSSLTRKRTVSRRPSFLPRMRLNLESIHRIASHRKGPHRNPRPSILHTVPSLPDLTASPLNHSSSNSEHPPSTAAHQSRALCLLSTT